MDIKSHTIPGIVSKFTFSSSSYSAEKGGSSLNFSGDLLSNLIPGSSIHLIDSGIHSLVPGFQNSVLNIDESQSAPDLVGALEKSLLWHDVQAIERATVAPEGATSASLSSSSYHPNYNVSLPHHTTAVGSSGHYDSISNLDLTKFEHTDSDNVSVFYEAAVDGAFAEAADLPKEIPPLGYFPFDNLGFNGLASDHVDLSAGRITTFSEPVEVVTPSAPELLPPIADPNDYSFSASTFIEAETSESPVFASVALQASQIFHFDLGNILTDPQNLTLPVSVSNLVDSDPDGSFAAGDFSVVFVTGHTFNNANGTWIFTISDEAGGDEGSISGWQLTLQTDTNTYVFNNPTVLTILDNTTVSSDITVSGVVGAITHVSLTLVDFQHTFFGDLVGTLEGSNGQSVNLFNRDGGGNDINGNVTLDDNAGSSISGASEPISGTFQTSSGTALNDFTSSFPTTLVVHGLYGDFTIHQDGTYTYQLDTANPDVIQLGTDQTLEDSVPYTMQDSDGLISSAILHVEILGTPNDPPIAQPNTYETDVDTIAPFVSGGYFVGNIRDDAGPLTDSDPDGNSFSVNSVINPILTIAGVDMSLTPVLTSVPGSVAAYDFDYNGHTGTFTINENGAVILTSSSGSIFLSELPVGQDLVFSFDYTDQDIRLAVSNTAHVDFTVHGDNDPPVAEPNSYVFDASTFSFDEGEASNSSSAFDFSLGNIVTDPVDSSAAPDSVTNPVDFDPEHTVLVVNSVSDPTLTIAGVGTPLTLVTGPLPAGEVAEYQFTFDGNTGTFIIFQDGSLNLDTGSTDLFSTLEVGQAAVFSFNYTDIDGDGLVSNAAPVTVTINGDNLPVANPDSVILSEPQVTGDQVFLMNILDNDNDGAGTRPLSVHDIVSGSPELTIAGTSFTLTPVTSSDPSVVAEYTFTFNGQTSDLTIAQNGDVTILPNGGQEIFVSLLQGEKVDFSFQYHNTDGVDISNVATATVEIDGEHNPPVPEPNFNIFYEPQVDASIASPGGFVVGNIITDLRFPSLPFDPVTNPVDTDPQGSPLSVNTVTTSTLAINGVDVPLAALTTLVHPTDVAEYQFSFGGNSAMLSIAQSGEVTLSSTDPTFFSFVNEQEEATIFNFNYDVIDQDGITSGSNIAHVSFTINGASDFASGDTLIIPETQVLGSSVTFINIINDDTSSLGLPLTMEDLSNPALMINSVSYNLTSVTPTDSSIFAEFSFSYNGHDSIFTIGKSGDVTLLPFGGQEIFEGLQDGQTADFTFSYRNTDGVATSPADNPGLVHIEITGDSPFANPNTYTLDVNGMEDNEQLGTDGNYHSVIGNILVDPEDPTLSFNPITNPVDTDSNNATPLELSVNTVANVSLTIDGTPETLTAVTGTLPAGEVAEYQFTFGTETDTFAISQDGTVSFVSASANFLQTLAQGESIVFDFDYTNINAADKPSSNSAHVDFTVHGDDDPPIAQPNNYTTDADTISPLLSGGYFVGNIRDDAGSLTDSDPEGDAFSVNSVINPILTIAGDPVTLTTGSGSVASYTFDYNGNTGTFTINADGSVILSAPSGGLFLEGLPVGQNLVFSFDYTDKDTGNLVSNAAHVDFRVAGDALPPIADPDIVFLSETDIVGNQVNLLNILGNDSSPSGHPLSVDHILVGDPNAADPSLSINNTSYVLTSVVSSDPGIVAEYSFDYNGQTSDLLISKNGDVSLLPFNGESIFQPLNDSQVAIFIFSYTNTDGVLPFSPTDVGIFINGITQPPQANPDENTVEEDTILSATGNVLTNDLFASSVGNPETAVGTYGTFVLNTDGSYTYTLDNDSPLVQALQQGETVDDQITYIAKNDEGATALSTLTIHVLGINDPPIAEPNTYTDTARNVGAMIADPNFEGLYYVGNIIVDSNPVNGLIDRDPENDGLSVQAVLNPSLTISMNSVVLTSVVPPFPNSQLALYDFTFQGNTGTFEIDNNGDVYLLAVSPDIFLGLAQGQDVVFSFDYTDRDTGSLISNIAHVDFTIHGDNDPPVAVNDAYQTDENTALVITTPGILFND